MDLQYGGKMNLCKWKKKVLDKFLGNTYEFSPWRYKWQGVKRDVKQYKQHLGHIFNRWRYKSLLSGGNFEWDDGYCRWCWKNRINIDTSKESLRDCSDSEQRMIAYRTKFLGLMKKFKYKNTIEGELLEKIPNGWYGFSLENSKKLKGYIRGFALGRQMKWSWVAIGGDCDVYHNVVRIKDYLKRHRKNLTIDSPYRSCGMLNYKKYEFAAVSNNKMAFFNVKRKWL
jgi:hypothetical protein